MYFTTKFLFFFLTLHVVISLLSLNRYAFLPFFSDLFIYLLLLVALGLITFLKNIYLFFIFYRTGSLLFYCMGFLQCRRAGLPSS